jgi:hypothetical protein
VRHRANNLSTFPHSFTEYSSMASPIQSRFSRLTWLIIDECNINLRLKLSATILAPATHLATCLAYLVAHFQDMNSTSSFKMEPPARVPKCTVLPLRWYISTITACTTTRPNPQRHQARTKGRAFTSSHLNSTTEGCHCMCTCQKPLARRVFEPYKGHPECLSDLLTEPFTSRELLPHNCSSHRRRCRSRCTQRCSDATPVRRNHR